jgi:hypothetical protein
MKPKPKKVGPDPSLLSAFYGAVNIYVLIDCTYNGYFPPVSAGGGGGGGVLGGLLGGGGGYGGYEDPYLHVNKRELVGGALLLGAGIIKGVIATSVFNSLSSNVQESIL